MTLHRTEISVRWAELDPYAHVNHAVYVGYLEVARAEALDHIGLSLPMVSKAGLQFVVVELNVKYKRAAEMGDQLVVETSLDRTSRATSTWHQRILRGDEVMIVGSVTAAVTDATGRPVRPPQWISDALERLRP
ncbi:MAG: thioesterase family protein [Acidimicrobiales bacterium]